ncbi:unnamed protein product [Tilletia controversa]|nr:hypothetical protein CF335_g1971 [Tilletia laevis]CAD6885235.1 unnamed protein product [Tilletia caries]CAD6962908.1 unnamed protein product [Tilletia controversa]CAD6905094.1 unnamed protein product [Tilletia caries]CAD6910393.1 unnamed protein product [Tilletia caries]
MSSQPPPRSYAAAIEALNSLQSNAAAIEALRKSGGRLSEFAHPEMIEYLGRIGYVPADLNRLNVVHITGTKGKGSTSAFTSALLQNVAPKEGGGAKVGLFTSPHMVAVRERIRIDGRPLEEDDFALHFWQVWDRLGENTTRKYEITPLRPIYFRFLTLLAFHTFLSHAVSATILEVGIGGLYDSTNIVPEPITTGVTALGLDHTFMLGNTIELIAAQKAGIYKKGAEAFAVRQPGREGAEKVLEQTAKEVGASHFSFVRTPQPEDPISRLKLGLPGPHQYSNASLALALAQSFARSDVGKARFPGAVQALGRLTRGEDEPQEITEVVKEALEGAHWPGRCQRVGTRAASSGTGTGATFFLDGAHTTDSLALCANWFVSEVGGSPQQQQQQTQGQKKDRRRVFVFNCTNGRSGPALLGAVLSEIERFLNPSSTTEAASAYPHARTFFSDVIFCTNTTFRAGRSAGDLTSKAVDPADLSALTVQRDLSDAWRELVGSSPEEGSRVHVLPSIEDAMVLAREGERGEDTDVLVSGSLHLVGGVMAHLQEEGALDSELRSVF